jgi:ankyrin repeat protein
LLENGANPNIEDCYGSKPLGTACGTGAVRSVRLLVEGGSDINHQNKDGVTALHECFYRGNEDCLLELMKFKPDTSIKHRTGKKPIDCVFIDDMHETLDYALND